MRQKDLFDKQMTRKEFLKVIGMAILTVFGVSNFITYFLHQSKSQGGSVATNNLPTSHGFGSRTFGN